jgi:hypothetical protein
VEGESNGWKQPLLKIAAPSGPTSQRGEREETVAGWVVIVAPEHRGGGSSSAERVTPMRLIPSVDGEVVDVAWEAKPRSSMVI